MYLITASRRPSVADGNLVFRLYIYIDYLEGKTRTYSDGRINKRTSGAAVTIIITPTEKETIYMCACYIYIYLTCWRGSVKFNTIACKGRACSVFFPFSKTPKRKTRTFKRANNLRANRPGRYYREIGCV